jgi:predicted nucleic acid-binding Zn ribbon protein
MQAPFYKMGKKTPEPIGDVLKNVVERLSQAKSKDINKIYSYWSTIVGEGFSRHSLPASLKRGTLLVNIEDSAWFYQMNLQKERLLAALQKKIGKQKVRRLQFRIGNTSKGS